MFKIKEGYKRKSQTPKFIKLFGSRKSYLRKQGMNKI